MLKPKAIIATWQYPDGKLGLQLQADGSLVMTTRETPSDVWGPPVNVGGPTSIMPIFAKALTRLVDGTLADDLAPKPRPDFDPHVDYPERYTDGPV